MPNEQEFDGQTPVSGYTLFHGKDGKSYYLRGEDLSDTDITQRVQKLRGTAAPARINTDELQQRSLGRARATAARPIVAGELNNPASPNFNRSMPGSFEGHPENVGEYIPASAGEMAGGAADIGRGNVAKGTHRIIGGASNALLPVLAFVGAAAPVATARILAGGQLGSMAGKSIGEGIGLTPDQSDVAGDIGGLAAGYGAAKIPAARAAIARQLYTPDQAYKPGVSTGARVAGGSLGSLTGGTIGSIAGPAGTYGGAAAGATAGAALGPTVLGKAFPPPPIYPGARLPLAEDFYAARAKDLTTRGVAQAALDRRAAIAARALKPDPFAGMTPTNVPIGNAPLPEVPQGNPTPFSTASTPHEIPGINAPAGRAATAVTPDFPKPLRPLVGTPEEIAAYEQQMNILGAEASDAGMYHAARGAAGKKMNLQQRMGRRILE